MPNQLQLPFDLDKTKTEVWRGQLRQEIKDHISSLKLPNNGEDHSEQPSKKAIRRSHQQQRKEIYEHERKYLSKYWDKFPDHFANGDEIDPEKIEPELEVVDSEAFSGYLFRYASLLWSVPVSKGYGRRIRYLVRDRQNGKLIGLFGLNDPVFNLSARDNWIGWSVDDRREKLVHVMDAHVIGAVPPYNMLLGGKLITALIGSSEVSEHFSAKYSDSRGIISQEKKEPKLVLVTVTSALGRSSIYNRLKLTNQHQNNNETIVELIQIGETKGYGHFHLSNGIFDRIRMMLAAENHPYAEGHQFGQGPNWRFRVIRVGLGLLDLDEEILRHGIAREVFAIPLCGDFREFLLGKIAEPNLARPTASEITKHALKRWIVPRAGRKPEFWEYHKEEIIMGLMP